MAGFFGACCPAGRSLRAALRLAGENRAEMEAFLRYGRESGDRQKCSAAEYLVRNMPGHVSVAGDWAAYRDSLTALFGRGVPEPEMIRRANAFIAAHPCRYTQDIETLPSEYLIWNLETSFRMWRTSPFLQHLTFGEFCETVLPYKCYEGQPADKWKEELSVYGEEILPRVVQVDEWRNGVRAAVEGVNDALGLDMTLPPLPQTGLMAPSLFDWQGIVRLPYRSCLEMSELGVLLGRACALPVYLEYLPNWPMQSQSHYWNAALAENGRVYDYVPFENAPQSPRHLDKRRAKVYRNTFAPDPLRLRAVRRGVRLAGHLNDVFVRDVTARYNLTADIRIPVTEKGGYAYLAVFDNEKWVPVQIGRIRRRRAVFPQVGRGVLYLVLSTDGCEKAISDPFVLDIRGTVRPIKAPDDGSVSQITLERKFPAFPHIWPFRDSLSHFVLEASSRADFRDAVELARWEDNSLFSADRSFRTDTAYRYWRLRGLQEGPTTLAEAYFYEAGRRVEPQSVSGVRVERLFDGNDLTSMRLRQDRSATADFGRPVRLDRVAVLRRGDGNGIKPGDTYQLYFWDGSGWQLVEEKEADDIRITFGNVPAGRLYRIRDITSGRQHRTFLYEDGKCVWY